VCKCGTPRVATVRLLSKLHTSWIRHSKEPILTVLDDRKLVASAWDSQILLLMPYKRIAFSLLSLSFIPTTSAGVIASPILARNNEAGQVASFIRNTLKTPSDTLSILLLIGGDVVAKALAQLSGSSFVPVAFSYGWVAYSFGTLIDAFGDGRLIPEPDYPAKFFNVRSGISRDNRSWVLGRLLRDNEHPLEDGIGMSIAVYRIASDDAATRDWCYYSGIVVICLQLGIATIPCALFRDWSTLFLTGTGTILALLTGALPQWRAEKFPGRRGRKKTSVLTGGNGSRTVLIIIDSGEYSGSIDLEDLAGAEAPTQRYNKAREVWFGMPRSLRLTQFACIVLAFLWIFFLLITTGLDSNPWYIILVGALGMLQNVIVAGAPRTPAASGIHVELVEEVKNKKVMQALKDIETFYPGCGRVLLDEFFAESRLRPDEEEWWSDEKRRDGGHVFLDGLSDSRRIKARADHARNMGREPIVPIERTKNFVDVV